MLWRSFSSSTIFPSLSLYAQEYIEECLSTLQFANRCRVVQNQPRITYTGEETPEAKDKRIKVRESALRGDN